MLDNFIEAVLVEIIRPATVLLFVVALAYFLWGMVEFIRNASSNSDREDGKQHMLWGVIGMFIMASAAGIITVIKGTFGL